MRPVLFAAVRRMATMRGHQVFRQRSKTRRPQPDRLRANRAAPSRADRIAQPLTRALQWPRQWPHATGCEISPLAPVPVRRAVAPRFVVPRSLVDSLAAAASHALSPVH